MKEKILYKALNKLGCTDQESQTYVELLKRENKSIAPLEEILGISRPNIYKLVNSLAEKSLIIVVEKGGNKKSYLPVPPNMILDLLEQKLEVTQEIAGEVSNALPDLMSLYRQGELPTSIKVYEGKRQFEKIFNQILKEAGVETQFFGSAQDFITFISWKREHQFIQERLDKEIKVRSLLLPSADASTLKLKDRHELRETRVLKDSNEFVTSFQLFGNKMVIWQPRTPLALIINDQHIIKMMRAMFEMLWVQAK